MQIIGAADYVNDLHARLGILNKQLDDMQTEALERVSVETASLSSFISHASMVGITGLLAAKANPNGRDNGLLHKLCKIKTDSSGVVLRLLLEAKANANNCDESGQMPLFWAQSASVVGLLVANKADVRHINEHGYNALHGIINNYDPEKGQEMVIRALNSRGVPVNAQTHSGETALHIFARKSQADKETHEIALACARELLACGVDETVRNHEQATALDILKDRNERLHCSLTTILLKGIAQERAKIAGECEPFLPAILSTLVARYAYGVPVQEEKE
jgi:hypothetical protein